MQKKIKIFLNSKWIKWGLIPFILFLVWFCLSIVYYKNNFGVTSLTSDYHKKNFINFTTDSLQKGNKIKGEFKANYDYLGIVAIRFNTYFQINEDIIRFRIKEKNSKEWYYQYDYTTPQFQPNQLFTFGFPVMSNSGGKTYHFEIESLQGEGDNAVAVSPIEPVFATKYQYPRKEISSNLSKATEFIFLKIINSLMSVDFVISTFAYILPFSFYVIYQLYFAKYLAHRYYIVLFPIMTMLFVESFLVNNTNDLLVIILTGMVAATMLVYKLESSITFTFALVFLVLTAIFYTGRIENIAENFAVWAYMLLVIGVLQAIYELKSKRKYISLPEFLKKLVSNFKITSEK